MHTGGEVIFSALLNLPIEGAALEREAGEETGQEEQRMFRTAYLSLAGARSSAVQDDTVFPAEPKEPEDTPAEALNAYAAGSWVRFSVEESFVYLTENASVYEQNSVAWSLYEYGEETLRKLAYPSYTFSVNAANFLYLEEFESFKDQLALGERIFLQLDEGKLLQPFVIGVDYSFSDPTSFSIRFSDKYCSFDAAFRLVDLLEQSVSMGKSVDFSKYTYRNFVDSGAQTEVHNFIQSALDVSKNAVLSSQNQAISWDESGLKLRKWVDDNDHSKGYEGDQIALINNNIVFTDNGFESVKMAIGRFEDETRGDCFGIVAPNIVGTLLASKKLMIQAKTEDNKTVLFQVDEKGAKLHNADFNIYAHGNQLALNPDIGIAIGQEPVYTKEKETGNFVFNKDNASFYVDIETGDAFFKGTIRAAKYLDRNGYEMMVSEDDYRFKSDYLSLYGLEIKNRATDKPVFAIDDNGNVSLSGGTINWAGITEQNYTQSQAYIKAQSVQSALNSLRSGLGYTYIDQNCVITANVYTNNFEIITPQESTDGAITLKGYFGGSLFEMLQISYYPGDSPYVVFKSPCSANASWNFSSSDFSGTISFNGLVDFWESVSFKQTATFSKSVRFSGPVSFKGTVDFSGATVTGLPTES